MSYQWTEKRKIPINFNTKNNFLILDPNFKNSHPDKKASGIIYGFNFLQVWPSLNIACEPSRQIHTDVCIQWISKCNLGEHLNDLRINSLIWLRNSSLRWPYLQKMETGFRCFLNWSWLYQKEYLYGTQKTKSKLQLDTIAFTQLQLANWNFMFNPQFWNLSILYLIYAKLALFILFHFSSLRP